MVSGSLANQFKVYEYFIQCKVYAIMQRIQYILLQLQDKRIV